MSYSNNFYLNTPMIYPDMNANLTYQPFTDTQQNFDSTIGFGQFAPAADHGWQPRDESDYSSSSSTSASMPSTPRSDTYDEFGFGTFQQGELFLPGSSTGSADAFTSPSTPLQGYQYNPYFDLSSSYPVNDQTLLSNHNYNGYPQKDYQPAGSYVPLFSQEPIQQLAGYAPTTMAPVPVLAERRMRTQPSSFSMSFASTGVPPITLNVASSQQSREGVVASQMPSAVQMAPGMMPAMASTRLPTSTWSFESSQTAPLAAPKARRPVPRLNDSSSSDSTTKKTRSSTSKLATIIKSPYARVALKGPTAPPASLPLVQGYYRCNWLGCTSRFNDYKEGQKHLQTFHRLSKNHGGKDDVFVQCELMTDHVCKSSRGDNMFKSGSLVRHVLGKICERVPCPGCGGLYHPRPDSLIKHMRNCKHCP